LNYGETRQIECKALKPVGCIDSGEIIADPF